MKDYREVAADVLRRSEEIMADDRRRKIKVGSATVCFCLIALLGVGAWQSGARSATPSDNIDGTAQTSRPTEPAVTVAADAEKWLTAEELGLAPPEDAAVGGLCVSSFISYRGGFYDAVDTDETDDLRFSPCDGYELLPNTRDVYLVENHPDWIAVHINGLEVYEKIFDVTFEVDKTTYAIAYSPSMNADYALGDTVLETEDYTVYEAVKLQGGPAPTKEYIVDILPLLRRELPSLFDGSNLESGGDYAEQWQLALPLE